MRITRTANEIVDIVNETVGMDICYADGADDIKIETKNDAEGNEICFNDYLFVVTHFIIMFTISVDAFIIIGFIIVQRIAIQCKIQSIIHHSLLVNIMIK